MSKELNSLRMRAERDGRHISGAERLLAAEELETAAVEMLQRALHHPRGAAQQISLQVERVTLKDVSFARLPDLTDNQVADWRQGRRLAIELLSRAGVADPVAQAAMATLAAGAAPDGQSMRGAMLIDATSGERLEADRARGVRVSRMDLSAAARQELRSLLAVGGLDNQHVVEALTLAGKVLAAPGMVAELCWSDDPDYPAGYVAAPGLGYQRISLLKPVGEERGGRAFFIRRDEVPLAELIDWLETAPLLFQHPGQVQLAGTRRQGHG